MRCGIVEVYSSLVFAILPRAGGITRGEVHERRKRLSQQTENETTPNSIQDEWKPS